MIKCHAPTYTSQRHAVMRHLTLMTSQVMHYPIKPQDRDSHCSQGEACEPEIKETQSFKTSRRRDKTKQGLLPFQSFILDTQKKPKPSFITQDKPEPQFDKIVTSLKLRFYTQKKFLDIILVWHLFQARPKIQASNKKVYRYAKLPSSQNDNKQNKLQNFFIAPNQAALNRCIIKINQTR